MGDSARRIARTRNDAACRLVAGGARAVGGHSLSVRTTLRRPVASARYGLGSATVRTRRALSIEASSRRRDGAHARTLRGHAAACLHQSLRRRYGGGAVWPQLYVCRELVSQ